MRISDWSSDVCSSDLAAEDQPLRLHSRNDRARARPRAEREAAEVEFGQTEVRDQILKIMHQHVGRIMLLFMRRIARSVDAQVGHDHAAALGCDPRSEEPTSELQSLMRHSTAVFCLNNNKPH